MSPECGEGHWLLCRADVQADLVGLGKNRCGHRTCHRGHCHPEVNVKFCRTAKVCVNNLEASWLRENVCRAPRSTWGARTFVAADTCKFVLLVSATKNTQDKAAHPIAAAVRALTAKPDDNSEAIAGGEIQMNSRSNRVDPSMAWKCLASTCRTGYPSPPKGCQGCFIKGGLLQLFATPRREKGEGGFPGPPRSLHRCI